MEMTKDELDVIITILDDYRDQYDDPDTYPPMEHPGLYDEIAKVKYIIKRIYENT